MTDGAGRFASRSSFSNSTTPHPALIPHEVAGSSGVPPGIPATTCSECPAPVGNPRVSPLSPEVPRPACHAGGRGFESRRSRKKPCKLASFVAARPPAFRASRTDPAREAAANPRTTPDVAADPRKEDDRPTRPEVDWAHTQKRRLCRYFFSAGNSPSVHPAQIPHPLCREVDRARQRRLSPAPPPTWPLPLRVREEVDRPAKRPPKSSKWSQVRA